MAMGSMDGDVVLPSVLGLILTFLLVPRPVLSLIETQQNCNSSIGIESGKVDDSQFNASSYITYFIGDGKSAELKPSNARLNGPLAWCTDKRRRIDIWLMVDLKEVIILTGITTQGFVGVSDYHVISYKIAYSINGHQWSSVMEGTKEKVFRGNQHGVDTIKNTFPDRIHASYIKIIPVSSSYILCLRIELYGCKSDNISRAHSVGPNTRPNSKPKATPSLSTHEHSATSTIELPLGIVSSTTALALHPSSTSKSTATVTTHTASLTTITPTPKAVSLSFLYLNPTSQWQRNETVHNQIKASTPSFQPALNYSTPSIVARQKSILHKNARLIIIIGVSVIGCPILLILFRLACKIQRKRIKKSGQAGLLVDSNLL